MKTKIFAIVVVAFVAVLGVVSGFCGSTTAFAAERDYITYNVIPNSYLWYSYNNNQVIRSIRYADAQAPEGIPVDEAIIDTSQQYAFIYFGINLLEQPCNVIQYSCWDTDGQTSFIAFSIDDTSVMNPSASNYYILYDNFINEEENEVTMTVDTDFTNYYFCDGEAHDDWWNYKVAFKTWLTQQNITLDLKSFFNNFTDMMFAFLVESEDGSDVINVGYCRYLVPDSYNVGYSAGVADTAQNFSLVPLFELDTSNVFSVDFGSYYGNVTSIVANNTSGILVTGPNTSGAYTACAIGLSRLYSADTKFKLKGVFRSQSGGNVNVTVFVQNNSGNITTLTTFSGDVDVEFVIPYSVSVIYLRCVGTTNFTIYNASLSCYSGNNYDAGFSAGYAEGKADGVASADTTVNNKSASWSAGYSNGYQKGLATASNGSFSSLFGSIADSQVGILNSLLDFDFLGFNMASFVKALLTIFMVVAIIRLVT